MDLLVADVNDYSIYHATTRDAAVSILKSNQLRAYSSYAAAYDIVYFGASFTRNLNYAKNWPKAEVIFSVDTRLLKHRYKLVQRGKTNWTANFYNRKKAEEFLVIGNSPRAYIPNFSDYINLIYISNDIGEDPIVEQCYEYRINYKFF